MVSYEFVKGLPVITMAGGDFLTIAGDKILTIGEDVIVVATDAVKRSEMTAAFEYLPTP